MLKVKVICVGKLKERFYTEAVDEYTKRLDRYCNIEIIQLPESRLPENPSDAQIQDALLKESSAIEKLLQLGGRAIALCVEGKQISSESFGTLLKSSATEGISRLNFIIGGSFGLHSNIKSNADILLSMSKMTFPHHLVRVMLLEQLYRAFNITDGGKYHK